MNKKQGYWLSLAVCISACGLGPFPEESGGDDNLPIVGAGPYRLPPADFDTPAEEPYVLSVPIISLLDPSARRSPAGFEVWYERKDSVASEIWKVDLVSTTELPEQEPVVVLQADADWEQGSVGAPAMVEDGDSLILYYHGGVDSLGIGRAVSTDGGQSFQKDPGNPIVAGATDPHVVKAGERWLMVHADPSAQAIHWRESSDGVSFGDSRIAIEPRSGLTDAFDNAGVTAPALHLSETIGGGSHYGLFYTGLHRDDDGEIFEAIGYQGSFEDFRWQPFLGGEPILNSGPHAADGASPVIGSSSAHLFFHLRRQGRGHIAVAHAP